MYEGSRAEDGRDRIVCTKGTERRMGGSGAEDGRERSGGWEGAERMYDAV